ncbi:MAG TPA: DUF1553 domain-containing protein [Pirellulales bacterium]|jgi:hypothetical protein|nr:DUF1553 domain-containing protein [Pirellulales bacterium]
MLRFVRPLLVLLLCALAAPIGAAEPSAEDLKFFEEQVRPILAEHCWKCHGSQKQKGGLRLDSRPAALHGGESGPAIVPGKSAESLLIEAINYASFEMPPSGKLADEQIATLTRWIELGAPGLPADGGAAPADAEKKITDEDRAFWSFQPVRRPQVPAVDDDSWCRNEVDRFIYQRLRAEGLEPAAPADRRTLLRRVYLDVTGLPPTAEEIEEFVADKSPRAFERVVDRLLASPHFGERWARHWLDLVRYGESDGYRQDAYRPEAWRYRDYVIRAINNDKPYDQFVLEQLAGDETAPEDPEALVATGLLRHWMYEYNQRDVRTQWSTILNDITDVTGDVFLGIGVGCARCHDHKFDPVLQRDYFRLQAFFTPLLPRDDVPAATPAERAEYAEKLARWESATADIRARIDAIERPSYERVKKLALSKFPKDVQPFLFKTREERAPLEQQIFELAYRQVLDGEDKIKFPEDKKKELAALRKELAAFDEIKPQPLPEAMTVTDVGPQAPPTMIPGDRKQRPIEPGFLSVLDPRPAEIASLSTGAPSTGRRTTLARWLASPENPLPARVMANRVWQYYFGRGLVATPSDFGRLGEKPSHPELLDWLASELVDGGWRMKHLHRVLLLSSTYRQSALRPTPAVAKIKDPENRLLWRMNLRRLDAEQARDAMLVASGELDQTVGGPSVAGTDPRRSVYVKVQRNKRDEVLNAFDVADGLSSCPARHTTTTPTQALLMINGPWALERANAMAARVEKLNSTDENDRISQAFRWALGREPRDNELRCSREFLARQGLLVADPQRGLAETQLVDMPGRASKAIELRDSESTMLRTTLEGAPGGDFTVEAIVLLRSLYDNASVRVIASQWNSDQRQPGWSLGVTSTASKYKPRNLILQLVGKAADGEEPTYEVIASDLRLELNKPYYVAVSVKIGDTTPAGITFSMKDLSRSDAPLLSASVPHKVTNGYGSKLSLVLGGREGQKVHRWNGLIDEVRLTGAALDSDDLLIHNPADAKSTIGHWPFDGDRPLADASAHRQDLQSDGRGGKSPDAGRQSAWIDFCHVLLNSNELLYVD